MNPKRVAVTGKERTTRSMPKPPRKKLCVWKQRKLKTNRIEKIAY